MVHVAISHKVSFFNPIFQQTIFHYYVLDLSETQRVTTDPPEDKKSKRSDSSHSSAKLKKMLLVMSLKYTPVKQSILCLIFLLSVAIMHN